MIKSLKMLTFITPALLLFLSMAQGMSYDRMEQLQHAVKTFKEAQDATSPEKIYLHTFDGSLCINYADASQFQTIATACHFNSRQTQGISSLPEYAYKLNKLVIIDLEKSPLSIATIRTLIKVANNPEHFDFNTLGKQTLIELFEAADYLDAPSTVSEKIASYLLKKIPAQSFTADQYKLLQHYKEDINSLLFFKKEFERGENSLNLSNENLHSLEGIEQLANSTITNINISNNKLKTLDLTSLFKAFPQLNAINSNNNNITKISLPKIFIPTNATISVANNPISLQEIQKAATALQLPWYQNKLFLKRIAARATYTIFQANEALMNFIFSDPLTLPFFLLSLTDENSSPQSTIVGILVLAINHHVAVTLINSLWNRYMVNFQANYPGTNFVCQLACYPPTRRVLFVAQIALLKQSKSRFPKSFSLVLKCATNSTLALGFFGQHASLFNFAINQWNPPAQNQCTIQSNAVQQNAIQQTRSLDELD